jgi:ribose 5-phosphate isomerase B
MKIAIASDHAGRELKSYIMEFLTLTQHQVLDYGIASDSSISVDYPDYADIVASEVSAGRCERGILVCGSGIGMCIVANKFPNVRAVVAYDEFSARMSRAHNDTNVLCLGSRCTNAQRAMDFIKIWLSTECEEGRHRGRVQKIQSIEKRLK